jgi:hypothetical protein
MIQLTENNGTKYKIPHSMDDYILPRCEFLLHSVKKIEENIIKWYKLNKYSQGDSYSVRITNKGKWEVRYSNDYPMQHGYGESYILTDTDFIEANKKDKTQ